MHFVMTIISLSFYFLDFKIINPSSFFSIYYEINISSTKILEPNKTAGSFQFSAPGFWFRVANLTKLH